MTAATSSAPTTGDDNPEPRRQPPAGDPFDHDVLPTPPGATGALLRSLLAPMKARVTVTTLLLLLQQAAVQVGPSSWRTPSTARYRRSGTTTTAR
jgi:ATP-binding cassette subfamily B protein